MNHNKNITELANLLFSSDWRVSKGYSATEQELLIRQIESKVNTHNELMIALVAFPFKIANPLKTSQDSAGHGEFIALSRLYKLAQQIEKLGFSIRWNIITDGLFYCDELGVPQQVVKHYLSSVQEMANDINLQGDFIELDSLIIKSPKPCFPMSLNNEGDRKFIVRTAGMINSLSHKERLRELFHNTGSVNQSIQQLLLENGSFRKEAERASALYQQRKSFIEESKIFETVFDNCIRASIQPDPNRNLQNTTITRPLGIRITDSRTKNLFPWLGVSCFKGEYFNAFYAEVDETIIV